MRDEDSPWIKIESSMDWVLDWIQSRQQTEQQFLARCFLTADTMWPDGPASSLPYLWAKILEGAVVKYFVSAVRNIN